ncbi:MAG: MerR family transcriptional regulator [Gammaproteobacteria bacterium]
MADEIAKKEREIDGEAGNQFRIGAVSRLTQIPVDTLRAWERRYNVVEPDRTTSAARLYKQSDVARLKLLKQLVDAGHAISSVAACSMAELEELISLYEAEKSEQANLETEVDSLIVYGDPEAHTIDLKVVESKGITVIGTFSNWDEFCDAVSAKRPDAVLLQLATILGDDVVRIGRLSGRLKSTRMLASYGFAANATIDRLERDGIVVLRAPTNSEEVLHLLNIRSHSGEEIPDQFSVRPRRLFDDSTLEDLAKISSTVQCECPHHLVDIVKTLNQFERYSAECESRSDEDAALHARLTVTTAVSRSMFEKALLEVALHEGIELPEIIRHGSHI